jgi:vitamin B12 transporter
MPRLSAPGYRVDDHAMLFDRIDNLFNEHYEDPTGFLRPDIGLFTGVTFTN